MGFIIFGLIIGNGLIGLTAGIAMGFICLRDLGTSLIT